MLPLTFTNLVPIMLIIGRKRKIKLAAENLKESFSQICKFLFFMYSKTHPIKTGMFKKISKGNKESGCENLNIGSISFIKSPQIIRKATLRPIDKNNISDLLNLFTFNKLRKINPGMKVRYRKPNTSLNIAKSKIIVTQKTTNNIRIESSKILEVNLETFRVVIIHH
ncbi:MAG: hypothetical protein NUK63_06065 [Candidatus Bathyarchaeum tardum]|nr:MAG: hypothetical protein NUK63_06065 [Candidatus Bathyarchaeum tardum]